MYKDAQTAQIPQSLKALHNFIRHLVDRGLSPAVLCEQERFLALRCFSTIRSRGSVVKEVDYLSEGKGF